MNLARRHFQKHQAQSAAEQAVEFGSMRNTNAYEQQLLQLNSDKARLKQIQSTQNKVELKRQLVPNYKPYIQGVLEVKPGVQDAVVTEMLIWAIDIGDYDFALDLAEYVLKFGLKLPDRFERSEACFITEDIAEAFLKVLKTNVVISENDFYQLYRLYDLINDESLELSKRDMPDEVKAKLYLALGKANMRFITGESELDFAYTAHAQNFLEKAVNLDDKCGGRTDLTKMSKLFTKLQSVYAPLKEKELSDTTEQPTEKNPNEISNPKGTTEQPEVPTNVLLNQNETPVVDDHGNMVPTSE